MNSRMYPEHLYTREVNSLKVQIAKLHCAKCFSTEIFADITDVYICKDCYSKTDFKNLLNKQQVRNKKIEKILS